MTSSPLVVTSWAAALLTALMAAPAAGTAEAQTRTRFEGMDRDNNGQITREEWRGSDRSFANHDWNGDGVLAGDEVRPGAQRRGNWDTADHHPNRFERNLTWTESGFNNLDHDQDGRLTSNEWHFDLETFRRVDRNRDNAVNLAEFLGDAWDDDRGDRFDDMDADNDGRVERAEWHGGRDEFRWLDRNSDGVLSRYEVAGSENTFDTDDQFQGLDYNRDGAIARNEWHWSPRSFTQRDVNGDGVLSRREFEALDGTSGGTLGATPAATEQNVLVNSQRRWTDTGITVRAGDVMTFNASGQIQMSADTSDTATPAGSRLGRRAPDAPVLDQLAGGLIARIGDYPPMFIGARTPVIAPVSGRLHLGVNDDHLADNRGEFMVSVSVTAPTRR